MENLKIESVIRAPSSLHRRYENRPSHALIMKHRGGTRYFFEDRSLVLEQGQLLLIPKGSSYTVQRTQMQESEYCLINFQADIDDVEPTLVDLPPQADPEHLFAQLSDLQVLSSPADRFRLHGLFYTLAAFLYEPQITQRQATLPLRRLSPALEHLRQHIFDPELRVGQLHRLCGISDTCFRSLFQSHFGTTPKKYILIRRLSHAKTILDNGEYDSIAQAARLSGFDDPLYFSKVFKAHYGYPPSAR